MIGTVIGLILIGSYTYKLINKCTAMITQRRINHSCMDHQTRDCRVAPIDSLDYLVNLTYALLEGVP